MSHTVDSDESKEAPVSEPSPPPVYSYEPLPPPPYPVDPETYPPLKTEAACTYQSITSPSADETPLTSSAFDDKTVRRAFVRKVFSILTLQLLFTFTVVCVFTFSSVVKEAVQSHIWAYLSSFLVFVVVALTLSFCTSLSRRHPWNLVALAVVTVSLSYMVGTIASYHDTAAVVVTMAATLVISLAIIAFSIQTRYDFTVCYGLLLILLVDLFMFGFFCTFYYSHVAQVAYGTLGALLFSLFLMVDIQLMMGTMSYRLSPEEYVNAALTIYLDIVLIFLYLLGRR